MTKQSKKSEAIKRLQTLRNIGPKMAEKLYVLGIRTPEQMKKLNPDKLYKQLRIIDPKADPCELYVFRGAILDIPWWKCKNLTKGRLNQNKQKGGE
jgi:hypothetical protein